MREVAVHSSPSNLIVVDERLFIIGRRGSDKLRAGIRKELIKNGLIASLHAQHLVRILLAQLVVHILLDELAMGTQRQGDRQQGVHLLILLVNLVILRRPLVELLGLVDVQQHLIERPCGVHVSDTKSTTTLA